MAERTVEDRLREEYFELFPEVRRVAEQLEAEIRYRLLPISRGLDRYERLYVKSRVKECESAIESLRLRQEGSTFDREKPDFYTLYNLRDLAGVRVLAFPRNRLAEIDSHLQTFFSSWTPDPVRGESGEPLAFKYHGFCQATEKIMGEYQIVSMLTGLFWEVEHSAIYKPIPRLKGMAESIKMRERTADVLEALRAFEEEFESLIQGE